MAALTSKREVTVDRQEFFVHAEIFATFVTIQHIKITSALLPYLAPAASASHHQTPTFISSLSLLQSPICVP